ncbi:MAG: UPF0182 family protein [Vicinamibacterales bacterium]
MTTAGRSIRVTLLAIVFAALVLVPSATSFYADWLWFGETGYQQVFLRTIAAKMTLAAFVFVATLVFMGLNVRAALRRMRPRHFLINTPDGGQRMVVMQAGTIRAIALAGVALVALFAALAANGQWERWLFYVNQTPFGEADPILGRDVGFYVFELPFLRLVQGFLLLIVGLTLAAVAFAYGVSGMVSVSLNRGFFAAGAAARHVALLAGLLLMVLAFGAWLSVPGLLVTPSGIVHGVAYVDAAARIPAYRILAGFSLAGAVLCAVAAYRGALRLVAVAFAGYIVVSLGGSAYAALLQRLVVTPNEQAKETPYIVNTIAGTRRAYALDRVEERELSGDAILTRGDIERNSETLGNVRLWDHQPLLDTFGQIQEIRTYYDFVSVDNDRYMIDGRYRQIMLSARELNSASLPNRSWINERLTFTHGYGVTLGPVNQVTPEGLPVLFIKNLPPESTVDLKLTQPSIYYGELSNDHVFVRTRTPEFHYPRGDDNVTTSYDGTGGVSVGTLLRRALFAIRFRSLKTLLSNDFTAESRVLFYRRIDERVRKIAPFLSYDSDPYISIAGGRLYWIQDAYTTSGSYPYSMPASQGLNYIRNSIKVVIDAYNGTTTFYLIDPDDPVAATIAKIFPGLLRPLAEMHEDLRTRLRYPEGIFAIQAAMYSTFHMTNPATFYNKEDQWEIPAIEQRERATPMQPYYTIMKLPGEQQAEFIQMLPFTPRQKDNLAAWMVSRSDGDRYGHLLVFQFPKQKVVFGPRQVVARISQDQVIAPQITLWNQQGSEVIQGTLLVIPIEESLIYVRPLYLRAAGGRIPELKRVIVAYQNQIVMEETLDAALARIFPVPGAAQSPATETATAPGASPAASPEAGTQQSAPGIGQLAQQAAEHYRRALAAQRDGNWALYGEEIKRLGEILEKMQVSRR